MSFEDIDAQILRAHVKAEAQRAKVKRLDENDPIRRIEQRTLNMMLANLLMLETLRGVNASPTVDCPAPMIDSTNSPVSGSTSMEETQQHGPDD